jgi:hypothetical protein
VAERIVEVFSKPSKMRTEWLLECFDLGSIRVVAATEGEELLAEGRDELELHCKSVPVWPAEATKRVYLESNKPSDPTFCLDFYPSKKAPGWGLEGLASEAAERSDMWVLYVASSIPNLPIHHHAPPPPQYHHHYHHHRHYHHHYHHHHRHHHYHQTITIITTTTTTAT